MGKNNGGFALHRGSLGTCYTKLEPELNGGKITALLHSHLEKPNLKRWFLDGRLKARTVSTCRLV